MRWWQLKHDVEKIDESGDAPWELSDSPQDPEGKESSIWANSKASTEPFYYDGWIWAVDVQAETFEEAVVKAKEVEQEFYNKL